MLTQLKITTLIKENVYKKVLNILYCYAPIIVPSDNSISLCSK